MFDPTVWIGCWKILAAYRNSCWRLYLVEYWLLFAFYIVIDRMFLFRDILDIVLHIISQCCCLVQKAAVESADFGNCTQIFEAEIIPRGRWASVDISLEWPLRLEQTSRAESPQAQLLYRFQVPALGSPLTFNAALVGFEYEHQEIPPKDRESSRAKLSHTQLRSRKGCVCSCSAKSSFSKLKPPSSMSPEAYCLCVLILLCFLRLFLWFN